MSILENIQKEEKDKIVSFIDDYNKKTNEFEISFFQNSSLLTLERFNNLNSVLNIISKNKNVVQNTTLDVILSKKNENDVLENYRITITGLDKINEYIQMFGLKKNELIYSTLMKLILKKEKDLNIIKKVKDYDKYITMDNYYMKIKLDEELNLDEKEKKKLTNIYKNFEKDKYNIIYRLKNRITHFINKEKNLYKIDLTMTKQAYNINNIENSISKNEIEMECLLNNKKTALKEIFSISEFIIKIIQQTNKIVSVKENDNIIQLYKNILSSRENLNKLDGRQPISLDLINTIDNLPNKYAVTDKADGDRYMLIVIDTNCYLISNNLMVKNIDIKVKSKFNNSIIDGEYIFVKKYNKYLFMAFDCLVISGNNCRNEISLMKRLSLMDELINEINKINVNFETVKVENMEKMLNTHKKNLYLMYDDIMENLKKTKNNIIVRKKYFINVLGLKYNEIFHYSNLLWKTFKNDSKLQCPYELDGLIYQPLEQKYVTTKSKYPDLKWKPSYLNSIDFYVEFEKDQKTGKILVIYDNTLQAYNADIDENEDIIKKNSNYYICNLYVGNTKNNIETPKLFSDDPKEYQCFLFLDETGNVRSKDGKIINDKTVVEFYYDLTSDTLPNMRWIPIRTRYDKSEKIKYKKNYGNSYITSKLIWNTIINPVTETDFMELMDDNKYEIYVEQIKKRIEDSGENIQIKHSYYNQTEKINPNFNEFQNWVKSQLIYTYINAYYNDMQYKTIDFGCGRGGDILKFYYATVLNYVGIEPSYDEIYGYNKAMDRYTKFKNNKKKYPNFPKMTFIQASSTNLLNYENQVKVVGKMNEKQIKLFNSVFNNDKTYFDRANSSMSLHYYLENEVSWMNFCQNLNDYLRPGAYFVFEVMNEKKIKNLLKDKDKYETFYTDNEGNKKLLFEIQKKYDEKNETHYGNIINVHMAWIFEEGVYVPEYLVNHDFIIQSLKKNCDMTLIESDNFETIYDDSYTYLKTVHEQEKSNNTKLANKKFVDKVFKYYENNKMNDLHKEISFLYDYYVFKKEETNLKEIKNKYYGQKTTIYTKK